MEESVEWNVIKLQPVYENTERAADFVRENIPKESSKKASRQLALIFDEIYSNIVKYSEATKLELKAGTIGNMVYLVFIDDGMPYNPLKAKEPDTQIPIEDRKIGGLGLFLIKRMADDIEYKYQNGENHLMVGKKL